MPYAIEAVALYIAVPLATIIGAIAAVQQLEPHLLSPYRRAQLGRLLQSRRAPPNQRTTIADALRTSLNFFDFIFGRNHWTVRCLLLSALFTIFFSCASILLIYPINRVGYFGLIQVIFDPHNLEFIAIALLVNILIDYLSLWETRFVLSFMRQHNSARHAMFLIVVDALFTLFIFIVILTICKTVADMLFLIPLSYRYGTIEIYTIGSMITEVDVNTNLFSSVLSYFLAMAKLTIYSMIRVLESPSSEYWFISLNSQGIPLYWMPASTMWATTHLASIFIYIYLILWFGATRLVIFKSIKMPKFRSIRLNRALFRFNFSTNEYPMTILTTNAIIYVGIVYILIRGWQLVTVDVQQ